MQPLTKSNGVQPGKLIVVEGPDGVGKSSIIENLLPKFQSNSGRVVDFAFPGNKPSTLGALVYQLHHDKESLGIKGKMTNAALQALHVAAHMDVIESAIIPQLEQGVTVLLDRFWWSTWVYGVLGGVSPVVLKQLIDAERTIWRGHQPDCVILLDRDKPLRVNAACHWGERRLEYAKLAKREALHHPVHLVSNHLELEQTTEYIWKILCHPIGR